MVDIQTVSIAIASASVVAGVVYYALQIQHQKKMRQTDLVVRLYSTMTNRDWLDAWDRVQSMQIIDPSKIDLNRMRAEHQIADLNTVVAIFDELGVLLQMRLIDIDLVERLFHRHVTSIWEKFKPVFEQVRQSANDPRLGEGFEYLYNEVKKREQRK